MGDAEEDKSNSGIPSWQLKSKDESSVEPPDTNEQPDRATIIKQAKRFLEEDEVKDASTDKKIAFLESKGLQRDDIQELLGVTRNEEATGTAANPELIPAPTQSTQEIEPESTTIPQPSPLSTQRQPPIPSSQPTNSSPRPPAPPARDQPPIITYPEFLLQPASPSPLITKPRLLTTLTLFSTLSALIYGTSTFLLRPMFHSLTDSRLSLTSTALQNLRVLVSRLEGVLSELPPKHSSATHPEYVDSETGSVTSDPTELFHRDIGVQTSIPSSPMRTSSPSWSSVPNTPTTSTTPMAQQMLRISSLQTTLKSLVADSSNEESSAQELDTRLKMVKEYCQDLNYTSVYGTGSSGASYSYAGAGGNKRDEDDEIARVKKEIRGVKGMLLSTRNFPGGVRAR